LIYKTLQQFQLCSSQATMNAKNLALRLTDFPI